MGVRGYNIIDDANAMFDYVNQSSDKEFILQKIKIGLVRNLVLLQSYFLKIYSWFDKMLIFIYFVLK